MTANAGGNGRPTVEQVEEGLRELHADYRPHPSWQARVLAEVESPARRPRRWWVFAAPLVAAAAIAALWWRARPEPPAAPQLAMSFERAATAVRGDAVRLGDTVRLRVSGGANVRALWIYRGAKELVLACPSAPTCKVTGDGIEVAFSPSLVGEHSIVAVWSAAPLPAPSASLDDEVAAALRARATIERKSLWVD